MLQTRDFWRRYVPFWNPSSPAPFQEVGHCLYRLPGEDFAVRSMLSSLELSLCYALARDHWSGKGEIVDLGCLYGLTTHCFASGLAANTASVSKADRIFAYDLFLADDYDFWKVASPTVHGGSLLPDFLKINRRFLDMIAVCPGDLLRMRWDAPVEILFVDAAKSWELNQVIVERFFPRLIPGAVVVQQDYLNWYEYWTVITMEVFADNFRPLYMLYGASSAYQCVKPIEVGAATRKLADLDPREKERLLDQAIRKAPTEAREAMLCAKAHCLVDHGRFSDARDTLASITGEKATDDPSLDFHGVVRTNRGIVADLLKRQSGQLAALPISSH